MRFRGHSERACAHHGDGDPDELFPRGQTVRGKNHAGVGEREREYALLKPDGVQEPRDSLEQAVGRGYIPSFGHFSSTSRLISSLMTISGGHSRLKPSMGPLAVASMPTLLP